MIKAAELECVEHMLGGYPHGNYLVSSEVFRLSNHPGWQRTSAGPLRVRALFYRNHGFMEGRWQYQAGPVGGPYTYTPCVHFEDAAQRFNAHAQELVCSEAARGNCVGGLGWVARRFAFACAAHVDLVRAGQAGA